MKPVAGLIFLVTGFMFGAAGKANSGRLPNPKFLPDLCKDSEDQSFCVSSLQTRLESGDVATRPDVIGIMAITVASENASSTAAHVKARLRGGDLDPAIESTLEDYKTDYQDAAEQLDNSIAGLLADVDAWLGAAIDAVESCQGALESGDGSDSELSQRNKVFLKLLKNALTINNKLI